MQKSILLLCFISSFVCQLSAQNLELRRTLLFDTEVSILNDLQVQTLSEMIDSLGNSKEYTWSITGHTDADGSNEYNDKLALRRALSVEQYLLSKSIRPGSIKRSSAGETQPIARNDNETGKRQNRRVEITLRYVSAGGLSTVNADTLQPIQLLFDLLQPDPEIFTITAEKDTLLRSSKGTIIQYKANSLLNADGKTISGDISLRLTEVYEYADMLRMNMNTTSNGEILSTRGMYMVSAEQGADTLKLVNNLLIMIPTETANNDVWLFTGDRQEDSLMNWNSINNGTNLTNIGSRGIDSCLNNPDGTISECPFFWCKFKNAFTVKSKSRNPQVNPSNLQVTPSICGSLDSLMKAFGVSSLKTLRDTMYKDEYQKYGVNNYTEYQIALKRARINNIESKYDSAGITVSDLNYYVAEIGQLNVNYNCDIFMRYPSNFLVPVFANVLPASNVNIKIVFRKEGIVLQMLRKGNKYGINAPKGREAHIVALQYKDNQPYMHISKIVIGEQSNFDIAFKQFTLQGLKEELQKLDN